MTASRPSSVRTVPVQLGQRSYPVYIGCGLLAQVPAFLPPGIDVAGQVLFMVTDDNARPYADTVRAALERAGAVAVHLLVLAPGEGTKNFLSYEQILSWMLDHGVTRRSVLFAVGGGVIGDLAGFAAATALRGIAFVQIPTTLLAQVDSGIGGKTGIDTPQGKNLVGAFHQPAAVICDMDVLATLDRRQRLAGYAEIVKYGLIGDALFFDWLADNGAAVLALDSAALVHAVEKSCAAKAAIVAADEQEFGPRQLLNLGHTFGHALETAAGYTGALLHGEAVAVGMVMAAALSARLGHCGIDVGDRIAAHLARAGLPVSIRDLNGVVPHDPERLVKSMYGDKKAETGALTFVLLRRIGEAFVERRVPEGDVLAVVEKSIAGG